MDINSLIAQKHIAGFFALLAVLYAILLTGCDSITKDFVLVETREYSGDLDGLSYKGWERESYTAEAGTCILSDNGHNISAYVESAGSDYINIKFSNPVVLPDKKVGKRDYRLLKNKTYIFVSGGGISGLEIKIRFN